MFSHCNTFRMVRFSFLISVQSFAWDFFVSTQPIKSTDWHSSLFQTSFNVTKGHVKPAKQLVMGIGIAAGRQAMHEYMGVVHQKKPDGASAPLALAATQDRDTGPGAFHSQQQLRRDLAAFNNVVLSSAAVSRLPWRRDGTVSLSSLASNVTAPIFAIITCFYSVTKVSLYFGK